MRISLQNMFEDSLARQGRRLFCWSPVGLALGSVLYFTLKNEPGFYSLFLLCLVLIAGIGVFLIASPEFRYPLMMRSLASALILLPTGFLLAWGEAHRQPPFPSLPYQAVWIRGTLVQAESLPPRPDHSRTLRERWRITLKNVVFEAPWEEREASLKRTIHVTLRPGETPGVQAGARVRLRALLKRTPPPSFPGGMDFQREAWFAGRAGGGRAFSALTIVEEPSSHFAVSEYWTAVRDQIARRISYGLSGQDAAFAMTVLCGETSSLSVQTRQDFAASGLAHLLAVAGLHLGLVMAFCAFMIRTLLVTSPYLALYWPCRTIAYVSALVIGGIYIALTGFHLPGLRALGMASLVILALLAGRQALSLRSLALVALVLEVTKPSRVIDVSFQMSFMAVMALITGYEVLRAPLSALRQRSWLWGKAGLPLIVLALTSLLAGSAVLPVSMAHFGAFQPWFVIANMVAVPLMGFWIMPWGLMALALMPLGLEQIPLHMMGWGIRIVRQSADLMAHAPLASLSVPALPSWGLVCILTGLALFCLWRGKARFTGLVLLGIGMSTPWLAGKPVLVISPEGDDIAFRTHDRLLVSPRRFAQKGKDFVLDSWQKAFALPLEALPENCQKGACLLSLENQNIMVLWPQKKGTPSFVTPSCFQVSLVINLSRQMSPCKGAIVLDRASVRREGSWAVYQSTHGVLRLVSDQQERGQRPWVMEADQEGDPGLPLAPSE